MGVNNRGCRPLSRLLRSRGGTAEIIGTVMFLVILLFFLSNVYLWHDQATREMDAIILNRVNSHVTIETVEGDPTPGWLKLEVTNKGGVGFSLSRLWIVEKISTGENHNYADFERSIAISARWLSGGASMNVTLFEGSGEVVVMDDGVGVYYMPSDDVVEVTFKILTDLGNTAAVTYDG